MSGAQWGKSSPPQKMLNFLRENPKGRTPNLRQTDGRLHTNLYQWILRLLLAHLGLLHAENVGVVEGYGGTLGVVFLDPLRPKSGFGLGASLLDNSKRSKVRRITRGGS